MSMVYMIWSGWEGSNTEGPEMLEYFKTKDRAVKYLKAEGFELKKQGYGPPLWERFNEYNQVMRWADIYGITEHE